MSAPIAHLSVKEKIERIKRTAVEIIPEQELFEKLTESEKTNKPLIVKLGCDPSRPDLHVGHSVPLKQLRLFQDMGHIGVLVIGDFTAMIGDPTGRKSTRPALTFEDTRTNGNTYMEQAFLILDPERTVIRYNSEWLSPLNFSDVIILSAKYTVARMLERDDFQKRFKAEEPVSIHEFLYPLAQGYDSVALESDIELGGTDQKFNLLVGRELQKDYGQKKQQWIISRPAS
jgi:tyrosyl-tRNA synthetase